jgi:hypothetical protein
MSIATPHFNGLSPAQAERLAYLIEELAEAQQAACKVLRHGYASYDPTNKDHPGNRTELQNELRDVLGAIQRMTDASDVYPWSLADARDAIDKADRYMHHQPIKA